MRLLKYIVVILALGLVGYYLYNQPAARIVMSGETMGTYYNIKVNSLKENKMLHKQIKQELEDVSHSMSVFDSQSEISHINLAEAGVWIDVSSEIAEVLKSAHEMYEMSNGAFDPTVGKLVDLWGFGVSEQSKTPSQEQIDEVLEYSGFDKIKFEDGFKKLKKKDARTYINLSALAKGYGVDRVYRLLKNLGYTDFVVEIGGEVRTSGHKNRDMEGWNIGVLEPKNNTNMFVVPLKNYSVATSGDYRNFNYIDGKKYSHTISPQTGYPVENNLTSVTVFDKECMVADAMSTAIMAMGEKKGLEFANNNKIVAIMFVRNQSGELDVMLSKKAEKMLGKQAP